MSKHANSAHRSLRMMIMGIVSLIANSAHLSDDKFRLPVDIFRLPGLLPRYGCLVHGHHLDSEYRWIMAWTRRGLQRNLDFRAQLARRMALISGEGNLDFRWHDPVALAPVGAS